jgi:hypothetical protein
MPTTLAKDLDRTIQKEEPDVFEMLSGLGRELYFHKGILTQSAEAKQKASRYNATIGIATEGNEAMHLPCVMRRFASLSPDDTLPYAPSFGL